MASALEIPNIVIAPIGYHRSCSRIATEEVIAHKLSIFCLISLEISIWSLVHQINECTLVIHCKEWIPLATPDNFDDIPTCTRKESLKFLNDLSITAHRTIKALQVTINNKS